MDDQFEDVAASEDQYTSGVDILHPGHLEQIKASGIHPKIARDRGYTTVTRKDRLIQLGFASAQCGVPGC